MRIRTIKPEFFTHEGIFDAEVESGLPLRIAFIGLWCAADREGRFRWEPRRLKVQILPYEDVDFSRVLDALSSRGFIVKYASESGEFGMIPGFTKHQVVNNREKASELPDPLSCKKFDACLTRERRDDHACKAEGKGKEGKGREQYAPSEEAAGAALSGHVSASKINTSKSEEGDFLFGPDGPSEVAAKVSVPRKEPARPATAPVETKDPRHHEITSQIAQPYTHVTGKPFPFSPKFAKVLQRFLAGWNGTADEFLDAYHDAMQASTKPYAPGCLTKAHDPSFFCLNYAEVVAATMRVEVNEKRQRIKAPF